MLRISTDRASAIKDCASDWQLPTHQESRCSPSVSTLDFNSDQTHADSGATVSSGIEFLSKHLGIGVSVLGSYQKPTEVALRIVAPHTRRDLIGRSRGFVVGRAGNVGRWSVS